MAVVSAAIALGSAISGALALGVTSSVALFAIGVGTQVAIGLALNALTPKPEIPKINFSARKGERGYSVNQRQPTLSHQIVYGKTKVGGAIVFQGTQQGNLFLDQVVAYTGHEIDGFEDFYLGEDKVNFYFGQTNFAVSTVKRRDNTDSSKYNGLVWFYPRVGTVNQDAIPILVQRHGRWTWNHRLREIACVYIRYRFDGDSFPSGPPPITAVIRGKKVYDPRTGQTVWSDNPALCIRDYLTSSYGLNEPWSAIDDSSVIAAANSCDELLGNDPRFTCNGSFTTDMTPYDILSDLLTSMAGTLWYSEGKWKMKAGVWTAPVMSLNEDDLRSELAIQTRYTRRENYNTVGGVFSGPKTFWQPADFRPVTSQEFIDADGGDETRLDLELPFTNQMFRARRIALINLERNRQQIVVEASFGLRTLSLEVGDNIELSLDRFGWDKKLFEVVSWNLENIGESNLEVKMILRETDSSVFNAVQDDLEFETDNTELLDFSFVPNVGINYTVSPDVNYQNLSASVFLDVTSSNPDLIDHVEVRYQKLGEDWVNQGQGDLGRFKITDIAPGKYNFSARASNSLGFKGEWTYIWDAEVSLLLEPPEPVEDFTAFINGDVTVLEWSPTVSDGLSHYTIRHTSIENCDCYEHTTIAVEKVPRPTTSVTIPTRPGTYFIKPVDKAGISSTEATSVTISADDLEDYSFSRTLDFHPDFLGTFLGVRVGTDIVTKGLDQAIAEAAVGLEPEKTLFVDTEITPGRPLGDINNSGTVNIGDALSISRYYQGLSIPSSEQSYIENDLIPYILSNSTTYGDYISSSNTSGEYIHGSAIDTQSRDNYKVRFDLDVEKTGSVNLAWDDLTGFFDSFEGLFDDFSSDLKAANTNVITYVRTTDDLPGPSSTWSDWRVVKANNVTGRGFMFKLKLVTDTPNVTPVVKSATVRVENNS